MITGGTGSFGKTFIRKLLELQNFSRIIVFSRDEKKQSDMMTDFNDPKLRFMIGDIRDRDRVFEVMEGVDYVFHAAALKYVPSCEFFPLEAIKTNVLGSANVLDAAEVHKVKKVVLLSTDKAAYPINAMGMTKALMEKLMIVKSATTQSGTLFCAVRYGNVMYSRGSVIPLFVKQIKGHRPLTITNPDMTRFLLPLPAAVELVLFAMEHARSGDVFVKKSPATTMNNLAQACLDAFGAKNDIEIIGIREGEKMDETLVTQEELAAAEEFPDYYRIKPDRKLDYGDYVTKGFVERFGKEGYTSANTDRLSVDETKGLLLTLVEIQDELRKDAKRV
jgi:UDP-glucose 4-epimerase